MSQPLSAALRVDDDDDVITVDADDFAIEVEGELGLDEILRRAAAEIQRVSSHPPPSSPGSGARRIVPRAMPEPPRAAARTPPFRPPNMTLLTSPEGRASVPRLLSSADRISELAPGRRVAFISGLIDGVATVEGIFDMSALDDGEVVAVLDTLLELGLMVLGDPPPPPRSVRPVRVTPFPAPVSERSRSLRPSAPPPFDDAFRLSVDTMLTRLDRSVAQLLGSRDSEDAMLREKRFHNFLATYHPDRFVGVELGPYRAKLERISAALVAAYEGRPVRAVTPQRPIVGTPIESGRTTTGTPIARISHRAAAIIESDSSELRPRSSYDR